MSKQQFFYTDGACKNNGRSNQQAYICVTDDDGLVLVDKSIGNHTSIEAEGFALIFCFEYIYKNKIKNAIVQTDSLFWVKAIKKKWKLKKPHLFPLRDRLYKGYKYLNKKPQHLVVEWIPREQSKAGWHLEEKYESKWKPYSGITKKNKKYKYKAGIQKFIDSFGNPYEIDSKSIERGRKIR